MEIKWCHINRIKLSTTGSIYWNSSWQATNNLRPNCIFCFWVSWWSALAPTQLYVGTCGPQESNSAQTYMVWGGIFLSWNNPCRRLFTHSKYVQLQNYANSFLLGPFWLQKMLQRRRQESLLSLPPAVLNRIGLLWTLKIPFLTVGVHLRRKWIRSGESQPTSWKNILYSLALRNTTFGTTLPSPSSSG